MGHIFPLQKEMKGGGHASVRACLSDLKCDLRQPMREKLQMTWNYGTMGQFLARSLPASHSGINAAEGDCGPEIVFFLLFPNYLSYF